MFIPFLMNLVLLIVENVILTKKVYVVFCFGSRAEQMPVGKALLA